MQIVIQLTDADHHRVTCATKDFVPAEVFDIHAHLTHTRNCAPDQRPEFLEEHRGYGLRDFHETMSRWLPNRRVEGLFFGYPSEGVDRAGENAWVGEQIAAVKDTSCSRGLVLAAPEDDPATVRCMLESGTFVGIKPYHVFAPSKDTREATIDSFAPEWMWQLCDVFDGVLMLHIMRAGGITDPRNIEVLRSLCRRYPNCRAVLGFHFVKDQYEARIVDLSALRNFIDLDASDHHAEGMSKEPQLMLELGIGQIWRSYAANLAILGS